MGASAVLSKDLSGVKPGIKTTELLYAAVAGVFNLLLLLGVIHTGLHGTSEAVAKAACAGAIALVSVGYSISRGITKHTVQMPLDYVHVWLAATAQGDASAVAALKKLAPDLFADAGISAATTDRLETLVKLHAKQLDALWNEIDNHFGKTTGPAKPDSPSPLAPGAPDVTASIDPTAVVDGSATESGPAGAWPAALVTPVPVAAPPLVPAPTA